VKEDCTHENAIETFTMNCVIIWESSHLRKCPDCGRKQWEHRFESGRVDRSDWMEEE